MNSDIIRSEKGEPMRHLGRLIATIGAIIYSFAACFEKLGAMIFLAGERMEAEAARIEAEEDWH